MTQATAGKSMPTMSVSFQLRYIRYPSSARSVSESRARVISACTKSTAPACTS